MTAASDHGREGVEDPRTRAGRPALARLLGPLDPDDFAATTWGRTAHLATVSDRGGDTADDLFSLDAADELVSARGLRTPFARVARDGSTLPDRAFTAGGGIGAGIGDQLSDDKLLQLVGDGATLVLQGLHRTWPPIQRFGAALAADLGHPVQVNAYLTPPQNQGFDDHYDVHDVFVLQVHGEKRWAVREPVHPEPLRDEPWTDHREAVAEQAARPPFLETTLRPGDCLYLPRGWIHSARALGGVSAHLTFGVQAWTRHHLAEALLELAPEGLGQRDALRATLPVGTDTAPGWGPTGEPADGPGGGDLDTDVETVRAALVQALRDLPAQDAVRRLRRRARAAQRPEPVPPFAPLAAAVTLTGRTRVRVREHLMLDVLPGAGPEQVTVSSRAGRFPLAVGHLPALRLLLERGETGAEARELASAVDPDPDSDGSRRTPPDGSGGEGSPDGLEPVRELLRRGLVVPVVPVRDTGGHA